MFKYGTLSIVKFIILVDIIIYIRYNNATSIYQKGVYLHCFEYICVFSLNIINYYFQTNSSLSVLMFIQNYFKLQNT